MNRFKSAFLSSFVALAIFSIVFVSASRAAEEITLKDGWAVQSSTKVTAGGQRVSEHGFDTSGWFKTSAPKTVFAVLVENGQYGGTAAAPIAAEVVTAAHELGLI